MATDYYFIPHSSFIFICKTDADVPSVTPVCVAVWGLPACMFDRFFHAQVVLVYKIVYNLGMCGDSVHISRQTKQTRFAVPFCLFIYVFFVII